MSLLSILIISIPSRFAMAEALYNHLQALSEGKDIEILLLMDNKKRSIGMKREAIKNISTGKYFMLCDDDDWLESIEEVYEACKKDVDVITFKIRCKNSNGSYYYVTAGLGNEVEHKDDGEGNYIDFNRPPFPTCAWNERFKEIPFPDINCGEDWVWAEKANKLAKTEIHIDKVINHYNFDPSVSEASTESNPYWTNPNIVARKAIVNFSTNQYTSGQERLSDSLYENFPNHLDYAVYLFSPETLDAPQHTDNPYAFKIYAIEKVKEMGYNQILWLDASVVAVNDPEPVFDWLNEKGIFMEEAGHLAGKWAPERVLKYFGITKIEALKMPMFAAGYVGIDFRTYTGIEFFKLWKKAMADGMFKGSWEDSRHDMTAGSIIANQMGLVEKYSPGGQFFAYIGDSFEEPKDTVCFHLKGIV